ncbi:MAG: ferredoxin family protein [Candidatus Odinarchaeota archaeon]
MTRLVKITVNRDLCKGCEICILFCPTKVLEEDEPTAWGGHSPCLIEGGETRCMLVRGKEGVACRLCEKRCPDAAIMVEVEEE